MPSVIEFSYFEEGKSKAQIVRVFTKRTGDSYRFSFDVEPVN